MRKSYAVHASIAGLFTLALALPAMAQEAGHSDIPRVEKDEVIRLFKEPGYSPYAGRNYPTRVFWGDTHLHTAISLDAAAVGAKHLGIHLPPEVPMTAQERAHTSPIWYRP